MPVDLFTVVKTSKAVEAFVTGGSLSAALAQSANSDVRAASLAIRNIHLARDPSRELALAVGHLQAAHVKLRQAWTSLDYVGKHFRSKAYCNSNRLDQWVCCVLAICYIYLREPQLVEQSVQRALEAERGDAKHAGWADLPGLMLGTLPGLFLEIGESWLDDRFIFKCVFHAIPDTVPL